MNSDSFDNQSRISRLRQWVTRIFHSFSPAERVAYYVLLAVFVGSAILSLWHINQSFLVEIPRKGGSLTEGVIGAPRFINPLLAISDADRDLTALVYSGLMRRSKNGELDYDLATSHGISEDGLIYTFTLHENAEFHDGTPVTAEDVIFTIQKAQDPSLRSPERASWEGVAVEAVNEHTVEFTLQEPYAPFMQNTTLGILPKHIWNEVDPEQFSFSQFNIEPIGSGPYQVDTIKRDKSGVPEYYDLTPFPQYVLGSPYITDIRTRFYSNEGQLLQAFRDGDIDAVNAISPQTAATLEDEGHQVIQAPLPRVFGVFFNQNEAPLFTDIAVRKALDAALDKQRIIDEVLHGYGTVIDGPIPPGSLGYTKPEQATTSPEETAEVATTTPPSRIAEARNILERNGWELNEEGVYEDDESILSFTLSTSNVPELQAVAEQVIQQWENLGAQVQLRTHEPSDLNQNVIRPRNYGALLFGEIVGRDSDLFAFWHSSQRNDPGLNVALYANITTDKLLEETRTFSDTETRIEKYKTFEEEIQKDQPAVFIYAPEFVYALPEHIHGVSIGPVTTPSERFLNIHEWFIKKDHVWRIFAPENRS